MTEHSGFPDIRIGHTTSGIGDEGVWPSFTDIMAVIVMIFLMALAVIMVQKLDLSRQLIATQSNQQEAEKARDTFETQLEQMRIERHRQEQEIRIQQSQLETLQSEVGNLETARNNLEDSVERLTEEKSAVEGRVVNLLDIEQQLEKEKLELEKRIRKFLAAEKVSQERVTSLISKNRSLLSQITGLEQQLSELELASVESIQSLNEQRSNLEEKLDTVTLQLISVQQLLVQSKLTNQELEAEIVSNLAAQKLQAEEYRITTEQMEALQNLIRLMELKIVDLEAEANTSNQQFKTLQEEYGTLEEKYRELVRPARSEAGKQVASVYFDKIGTEFNYRIREPGQESIRSVSRAELDEVLQRLKDQFGQELYVRIVIPEDSILTHGEAWSFTDTILRQFDYYYQPEAIP
ncbi:MAG: hypothetical protein OXE41_06190 [Gammaproteobacteria bacterium]|nr:hypothetical protein [Gammaproteobacteria bacterium]